MAGNSKDSKILAYKDMINQLNKTISTQTELIQSLQKTLEADRLEKENLHQQIEYLTKKLFGTSSEKRKNINSQLNLFDEAEQEADPTWEQELPDDITVPEHKRKARRTHADLFKNVPSCNEIISLPEEERNCPTCGTQVECIGKEFVRHEFRFTPAKGKVVNIYRETYKCPECAISEEHPDDQTFVKATVQEPLIPESYASESVVGWAMHQKYQNGLPLNRQEEDWKQLGVPLSRATLANWIIYCAENYLRHVYDYFHRQLRGYYIVGHSEFGCSIFSKITAAEKEGKTEFPFTMGQNQFDFIDYEDFCKQVAAAVGQDEINGIINICSGKPEKLADRVQYLMLYDVCIQLTFWIID